MAVLLNAIQALSRMNGTPIFDGVQNYSISKNSKGERYTWYSLELCLTVFCCNLSKNIYSQLSYTPNAV